MTAAALSCSDGGEPVRASISNQEALARLDDVITFVEEPLIEFNVYTTELTGYQNTLLQGRTGSDPDHKGSPGLDAVRRELLDGDTDGFCVSVGLLLRDSLVNRIMDPRTRDAVSITDEERSTFDPRQAFLDQEGEISGIGHLFRVDREVQGIEGTVVSELWKGITLELIDIVYGLGQECVDAAKEA